MPPPRTISHKLRRFRWLLAAAVLGASVMTVTAQIMPEAPVINFRLPMFGDDGNPLWDLRGKEGHYINADQVDLRGMRLMIFDKEIPDRIETEIISPAATMFIDENQVRGNESITVKGENFVITGNRWLYDTIDRRVEIDEDVKITFFEDLGGMLVF